MTIIPLESKDLDEAIDFLYQSNTFGSPQMPSFGRMSIYEGQININDAPSDTFLNLKGWTKGYAWVNGFLLGRYWPIVGPQVTLYVPKSLLLRGENKIRILELEISPCQNLQSCTVTFEDSPIIDGNTPEY